MSEKLLVLKDRLEKRVAENKETLRTERMPNGTKMLKQGLAALGSRTSGYEDVLRMIDELLSQ